ncbi:MAG: hypothetical protein N2V78_09430 [Methanophagales archaeon]|nr:hypothetical protein [Methanophagales archaeon]
MKLEAVKKHCKEEIEIWRNKNNLSLFPFCVACEFDCRICPIYQYETEKNNTKTRCVDVVLLKKGRKGKKLSDYRAPRWNASKAMRKAWIEYLEEFPEKWEEFLKTKKIKEDRKF